MLKTFGGKTFRARTFWPIAGILADSPAVAYQMVRIGDVVQVAVTTTAANVAWYCWYVDGAFVAKTREPAMSFQLPAGDQARLDVIPTADENFDPIAGAPDGYPSRRTLWWVRSVAIDAAAYRIEQREGTGDWSTIAVVTHDAAKWDYAFVTDRLNDLTAYTWRIIAIDAAGNEAAPLVIGPETLVRTPDAPGFAIVFDADTRTVEFTAA